MWVRWGPVHSESATERSWRRHERFLHDILGVDNHQNSQPINGWLLHDPESIPFSDRSDGRGGEVATSVWQFCEEFSRRTRKPLNVRTIDTSVGPGHRPWVTGRTGRTVLDQMIHDLRFADEHVLRPARDSVGFDEKLLNLQGCRIYLGGAQVAQLLSRADHDRSDLPGHACLDLRFRRRLGYIYLCATLSLWSRRPSSNSHIPDAAPRVTSGNPSAHLREIKESFYTKLKTAFEPIRFEVFGKLYRPPQFLIVAGDELDDDSAADLADVAEKPEYQAIYRRLLLASDPRAVDVAHSWVYIAVRRRTEHDPYPPQSHVRIARRFDSSRGAPRYLVHPDDALSSEHREAAVREFIYAVTNIETAIAIDMYDISTDLDIDARLIDNYAFTVREASAIWDELSMHLVAARGAKLNYAHERAELLHQVLLQGTADLEEVQTNVRRHIARIDQALDRHLDEYDRKLTERPIDGTQSTREAMRGGRLVELTRRSATTTSGEADRAVEATQSLLDAVARAFDERRVRMTDKLGVLALVAAVALAVVPFVTELWARFISGMSSESSEIPLLTSIVILLVSAFLARRYFNHSFGTLQVSHEFRKRYQSLLEFMTATRTELFDGERTNLRHSIKSAVPIPRPESAPTTIDYAHRDRQRTNEWNRYYTYWDNLDQELAEKCADQIDQLQRPFEENRRRARWRPSSWWRLLHRHKKNKDDELAMLGDKIELWALRSLFITERPRQIYRFPLIRLILLYSAYETWFETLHPRPTPSLVANSELMLATRLHCHAEDREAKIVVRWM